MRHYKLLPHTADIRLKVEASTIENLFLAALDGMAEIIKPNFCTQTKDHSLQTTMEISSVDSTALIIDFLSGILMYSQINKAVYCHATFETLESNTLQATIFGTPVDSFDEDIKAVTYHEAEVKKNEAGNWETVIIFDI